MLLADGEAERRPGRSPSQGFAKTAATFMRMTDGDAAPVAVPGCFSSQMAKSLSRAGGGKAGRQGTGGGPLEALAATTTQERRRSRRACRS